MALRTWQWMVRMDFGWLDCEGATFANAVEKLSKGRVNFAPVVTGINEKM